MAGETDVLDDVVGALTKILGDFSKRDKTAVPKGPISSPTAAPVIEETDVPDLDPVGSTQSGFSGLISSIGGLLGDKSAANDKKRLEELLAAQPGGVDVNALGQRLGGGARQGFAP